MCSAVAVPVPLVVAAVMPVSAVLGGGPGGLRLGGERLRHEVLDERPDRALGKARVDARLAGLGAAVAEARGAHKPEAARRYSPGKVVAVERKIVLGEPEYISTSYVERQNLTLRMSQRRFTRLTNAFSKKLENHMAAVALYVAHYNFCRVHEALRITPAMQLGITDHVWAVGELVDAR